MSNKSKDMDMKVHFFDDIINTKMFYQNNINLNN